MRVRVKPFPATLFLLAVVVVVLAYHLHNIILGALSILLFIASLSVLIGDNIDI